MSEDPDHPIMALVRMHLAVGQFHPEAATVLACHIALERELSVVLKQLLPRPEKLRNVGFVQKVQIMNAAWRDDTRDGDAAAKALIAFNEVRNAIGHGNDERVEECLDALKSAYRELHPSSESDPSIQDMAGGIMAYIVSVPTPAEIRTFVKEEIAPAIMRFARFLEQLREMLPETDAGAAGTLDAPRSIEG